MADYILREAATGLAESGELYAELYHDRRTGNFYKKMKRDLLNIPAAEVVSMEDYKHLLKAARAMHTWIFLNTCDEQKAYDECHLTDEDNAMLGYGGQFILAEQQ